MAEVPLNMFMVKMGLTKAPTKQFGNSGLRNRHTFSERSYQNAQTCSKAFNPANKVASTSSKMP